MSGSRAVGGSREWASCAVIIPLLLIASAFAAPAQIKTVRAVNPVTGKMVEAVDGQILVVPRPGVTIEQMKDLCHRMNAVSGIPFFRGAVWSIRLPAGQSVGAAVAQYGASGLVRSAEPEPLYQFTGNPTPIDRLKEVPSDPRWSELWGLQKIECAAAWDSEKGDPSVIIAIIDSGVDYNHVDLAGHMWTNAGEIPGDGVDDDGNTFIDDVYGWDWHDGDNDPAPDDTGGFPEDHGTHVAGTASAVTDNALGVAGVAWNAQIMALRVGSGAGIISTNVYAAMQYAADMGADVINLSLGGPYTAADQATVDYAYSAGITICASLGNSNVEITTDQSTWVSPVCNDGLIGVDNKIIGVAATDENDMKAAFGGPAGSNYSGAYQFCDVSAPGVNILSTTWPGDTYGMKQGTSMSCPHVTGLAALVISQLGKGNPGAVIDQIRATTVDIDALNPLYAGKLGTGRISAAGAVGLDLPPAPATAVNAFDTGGDEGGSITVTWRKSADDGVGRNDVIGYELFRGQVADPSGGGFSMLAGLAELPAGSSGYKDEDPALVDGLDYYYFVRTKDATNAVDSNVAGPVSPRDDAAPDSVDVIARDTQADDGRSMTLTWVSYTGPADLTAFRIYRSELAFSDVTEEGVSRIASLADPATRSYVDQAADPDDPESDPKDLTDYWYAVTALDEASNEITAVTAAGPVQAAPNLSVSFNTGLQMITIPAEPVDDSPMSVFGITDPSEMEFARYDPITQAYKTLAIAPGDPALRIVPGRGFWLDRPLPSFISVAGHAVADLEYEVPLDQGWNIVGSAYDAAYPFVEIDVRDAFGTDEDITSSNLVRKYGWRYDAFERSYKLVSPLLPGGEATLPARESMWVYAFVPGVKLVFHNNVAIAGATEAVAEKADLDGWQLRLVARTANAADTDNIIGVSADARKVGTVLSPPAVRDGVDLFFGEKKGGRSAVDLRQAVGAETKWVAVVECGAANTDVEVTWPELGLLPPDVKPILKDLATGRSLYMRTATAYRYRSRKANSKRRFEVTVPGVNHQPAGLQIAAVPNNAGGAEIVYTLIRPAKVNIAVRNIAGRLVAQVATERPGEAGLNRVVWHGTAANGVKAPAGQYIIVITAVAEDNGETVRGMRALTIRR